jgi:hypothetical protein
LKTMNKIAILVSVLGLCGIVSACFGSNPPASSEINGAYDSMALPTTAEKADLQKFAMSHGVDLDAILKELPEDDRQAWKKVFGLTMHFTRFDRSAEVYGYRLFTAFSYFIDSVGEAKFADLIDGQSSEVRQRVRDFLYYEAVNADHEVMKNNERLLRMKLKRVFPASYSFGANDPLFESFRQK